MNREILARVVCIVCLLTMVSSAVSTADPVRLVENGSAIVTVVVDKSAGSHARAAAEDLAGYLGESLGSPVEISDEPKTRCAILVGSNEGVDLSGVGPDGFAIKRIGDSVAISGTTDRGTANGVYTFLMEAVGARWFGVGELFEVIPDKPDLNLPDIDVRQNPDFQYRSIWGGFETEGDLWARRNRLSYPGTGKYFGHNVGSVFPSSVYGEKHPEYYAMIDGKRVVPKSDSNTEPQPCFTNPDVIGIAAEAAQGHFGDNPQAVSFSLSINDSEVFCHCPECQKLDRGAPRSINGAETCSDSYYYFLGEVAKRVERTCPGKLICGLAYWCVEQPPRHINKLPDNVALELTQDSSQYFDPDYERRDEETWMKFSRIVKHIGRYDWYGLSLLTPRYYPHSAARSLKSNHQHGAEGVTLESYCSWVIQRPQLYLAARLTWNINLGPDEVLKEYFEMLYGDASAEMARFYDLLEQFWTAPRKGQYCYGAYHMKEQLLHADGEVMEEAWRCLMRAKSRVSGVELRRIKDDEHYFEVSYLIVKAYWSAKRIAEKEIRSRADISSMLREASATLKLMPYTERICRERWGAAEVYKALITPTIDERFKQWGHELRSCVEFALRKALHWSEANLGQAERDSVRLEILRLLCSSEQDHGLRPLESIALIAICQRAPRAIDVDGDLDDWSGVEVRKMSYRSDRKRAEHDSGCFSSELRICWDAAALYIACELTDPKHSQTESGSRIWRGDCLQIGIDSKPDEPRLWGNGDGVTELGFAISTEGPVSWRWRGASGQNDSPAENVRFKGRRLEQEHVTISEAAIPWSDLGLEGAPVGETLGLAVGVIDHLEDGHSRFLEWGSGIFGQKDPKRFALVQLIE